MSYIALIFAFAGSIFVTSLHRKTRAIGFSCYVIGNVLWSVWCFYQVEFPMALFLQMILFTGPASYGIYKNIFSNDVVR